MTSTAGQAGYWLYLLLGCLCGLTSMAALDLRFTRDVEDLLRSGQAYAAVIDHPALWAHLRLRAASLCFWDGRPREARERAGQGLAYLVGGPVAANLHVRYATAAARLGDADGARRAVADAVPIREPSRSTNGRIEVTDRARRSPGTCPAWSSS